MIRRQDITTLADGTTPRAGVFVTVRYGDDLAAIYDADGGALIADSTMLSGIGGSFEYWVSIEGTYTEEFRLSALDQPRVVQAIEISADASFTQLGIGAVTRPTEDELRERALSITQYGASTALSGATQRAYLQAAVAAASAANRPLRVPHGEFAYSGAALSLPDGLTIIGDDRLRSILYRTDAGVCLAPTSVVTPRDITLRGVQIKGGTVGFDVTASNVSTEIVIDDCFFHIQSVAGVRSNQMMISWSITRNIFDSTTIGVQNLAANATNTRIVGNQFKELGGRSIDLRGGVEAVNIQDNRFEARNLPTTDTGSQVIYLELPQAVTVQGNYFEDTFRTLVKEIASTNTTRFIANRCSGQENTVSGTGPKTELFETDGVMTFGWNDFFVGSNGAPRMLICGPNRGLVTRNSVVYSHLSASRQAGTTPKRAVTNNTFIDILTPVRVGTAGVANRQKISGKFVVDYEGVSTADGSHSTSYVYHGLEIKGFSNTNVALTTGTPTITQDANTTTSGGTITLGLASASATTGALQAKWNVADFSAGELSCTFDFRFERGDAAADFTMTVAA